MAINLNGVGSQPTLNKSDRIAREESAVARSSSSEVDSKKTLAEDTVQISSMAQSLQASAGADEKSSVDMDKVEQIKQALAAGEYKIDTEKLASRMMAMDSLFA